MTLEKAKKYLEHMLWCMAEEPPQNLTDENDIKEWEDEHKNIRKSLEIAIITIKKQIKE